MNTLFVPLQHRIASTYVRVSLPFQHPSSSSPTSPTAVCCAVAVEFPMHCPSPHTHTTHTHNTHKPLQATPHLPPSPPSPQQATMSQNTQHQSPPSSHHSGNDTTCPIPSPLSLRSIGRHCVLPSQSAPCTAPSFAREQWGGTTVDGAACGHCALTWHWVIYLAPSVCLHVHGEAQ